MAPYSFNWSNVLTGTYSLTARATDNLGAVQISSPISVTVNLTPTVSLTNPTNGAAFVEPAQITLTAAATDTDGSVTNVAFFEGLTNEIGQSATAPYAFVWTNVPAGSYSFTAQATDNLGASTTSSGTSVTVYPAATNDGSALRLGYWRFESTNWVGEQGQTPIFFTKIQSTADGSNNVLQVNAANPANLKYRDVEDNHAANIDVRNGTVLFWFKPDWNSATAGGAGPGSNGQLLSLGQWTSDASYGCWNLSLSAEGSTLSFICQTNGAGSTNLTAAINWLSTDWHQIALTYSPSNSALYLDGQLATTGSGVSYYLDALVRAVDGINLGSDRTGNEQAKGQFDELESFNYPLGAPEVSRHYDSDGDDLNNLAELRLGTDPTNPDTDGDGLNDYLEYIQGRNPRINGSVSDTNGLIRLQVYTPLE